MNRCKMPNDLTREQLKAIRVVCNLPADLRVKLDAECFTRVYQFIDNYWLFSHFGFLEAELRENQSRQLHSWVCRNTDLVLNGGKRK